MSLESKIRELLRLGMEIGKARNPVTRERQWQRWARAVKEGGRVYPELAMRVRVESLKSFREEFKALLGFAQEVGVVGEGHKQNDRTLRRAVKRDRRTVFVVCGRDEQLRKDMFALLEALDLRPLEWEQAVKKSREGAPFIGGVLAKAFRESQAIVVLLSPDDEGRLRRHFLRRGDSAWERTLSPQARMNVVFEAGMAFGHDPKRTILVECGQRMRPFSDIAGRHVIRVTKSVGWRQDLVARLKTAGCRVDITGRDYLEVGLFGPKSARGKLAR